MFKNPFKSLTRQEWLLWFASLTIVLASNILSGKPDTVNLLATATGVTALIFIAKGNVWGQILTVIFSFLYSVASYRFRYFGEMITYLGMTMPSAVIAAIEWLRHPFKKGEDVVKIHALTKKQTTLMILLTVIVTIAFYYILKIFNTANLIISTISITTSFLASYLMIYRNPYYAIAYSANDIVLIILWILATIEDIVYLPMIMCFVMFLVNDIYGFICWKIREKEQQNSL